MAPATTETNYKSSLAAIAGMTDLLRRGVLTLIVCVDPAERVAIDIVIGHVLSPVISQTVQSQLTSSRWLQSIKGKSTYVMLAQTQLPNTIPKCKQLVETRQALLHCCCCYIQSKLSLVGCSAADLVKYAVAQPPNRISVCKM